MTRHGTLASAALIHKVEVLLWLLCDSTSTSLFKVSLFHVSVGQNVEFNVVYPRLGAGVARLYRPFVRSDSVSVSVSERKLFNAHRTD